MSVVQTFPKAPNPIIVQLTQPNARNGLLWVRTSDYVIFKYDGNRLKWLSIDPVIRPLQRNGDNITGNYLRQYEKLNTNQVPIYFGFPTTLVSIVGTTASLESWVLRLEDHKGVFSNLDITIDDGSGGTVDKFSKFNLNTDYEAANEIQALIFSSISDKIDKPLFYLDFRRRP